MNILCWGRLQWVRLTDIANKQLDCKKSYLVGCQLFFFGDPGQLPPVGDKPLYHAKPSTSTGEQGYCAYQMFVHVVVVSVHQRISGPDQNQILFRGLLLRLHNGETTQADWKQFLARQRSKVRDIDNFQDVARLYYTNTEVAAYNYL